jgi:HK97 family phage major capsid protein
MPAERLMEHADAETLTPRPQDGQRRCVAPGGLQAKKIGDFSMSNRGKLEVFYATLREMRQLCIDEGRQPSKAERNEAREILAKIKKLEKGVEAEEYFSPGPIVGRSFSLQEGTTPTRYSTMRNGVYRPSSGPFRDPAEQLLAIVKASTPGGEVDPRLAQFRAAATGLEEGIPSSGGFLFQQDFSDELLRRTYQQAVLASLCTRMTISANANGIKLPAIDESSRATGSRLGGVQVFWTGEATKPAASKPKFRTIELSLKKLMGLCYATDELLQDSQILANVLQSGFAAEIAFMLDDAILRGGAGMPLGILSSPALVTVPAEANQLSKTVVYENLLALWARMPARNRANAVWVINQDIEPQLYSLGLAIGTGGSPIFMPGGGISGSPYSTIFGRPLIPIEQASTLGSVGDILLCDFSEYLLIEKGGIDFQGSIHVRFEYGEQVFRTVYRVDGMPIPIAIAKSFFR